MLSLSCYNMIPFCICRFQFVSNLLHSSVCIWLTQDSTVLVSHVPVNAPVEEPAARGHNRGRNGGRARARCIEKVAPAVV